MTGFLGASNIFIFGDYASIMRNVRENKEYVLFSGENIDLLALASLVGFHYNRRATMKNEESGSSNKKGLKDDDNKGNSIELSRIQFPKLDNQMWFIARLMTICMEGSSKQSRIDLAFREFANPEGRKKMFEMWFDYALGGLEVLYEKVIENGNGDKHQMAENLFELLEEFKGEESDSNAAIIDDLLRS